MTENDAKYLNKIKSIENDVFNQLVSACRWHHNEDIDEGYFEDCFNEHFNNIEYKYTKQFLKEFGLRNVELKEVFSREWFDFNNIEESEKNFNLLDFHLNQFAWKNFKEIVALAKW